MKRGDFLKPVYYFQTHKTFFCLCSNCNTSFEIDCCESGLAETFGRFDKSNVYMNNNLYTLFPKSNHHCPKCEANNFLSIDPFSNFRKIDITDNDETLSVTSYTSDLSVKIPISFKDPLCDVFKSIKRKESGFKKFETIFKPQNYSNEFVYLKAKQLVLYAAQLSHLHIPYIFEAEISEKKDTLTFNKKERTLFLNSKNVFDMDYFNLLVIPKFPDFVYELFIKSLFIPSNENFYNQYFKLSPYNSLEDMMLDILKINHFPFIAFVNKDFRFNFKNSSQLELFKDAISYYDIFKVYFPSISKEASDILFDSLLKETVYENESFELFPNLAHLKLMKKSDNINTFFKLFKGYACNFVLNETFSFYDELFEHTVEVGTEEDVCEVLEGNYDLSHIEREIEKILYEDTFEEELYLGTILTPDYKKVRAIEALFLQLEEVLYHYHYLKKVFEHTKKALRSNIPESELPKVIKETEFFLSGGIKFSTLNSLRLHLLYLIDINTDSYTVFNYSQKQLAYEEDFKELSFHLLKSSLDLRSFDREHNTHSILFRNRFRDNPSLCIGYIMFEGDFVCLFEIDVKDKKLLNIHYRDFENHPKKGCIIQTIKEYVKERKLDDSECIWC